MLLTFRDCELDTTLFALRCGGRLRQVEPLVFNLLAYLIRQRDRVVSRQELLDTLWCGKVVSESALSSCVKAARQAVGDDGQAQRCIATVQRRGYRFVAPVDERSATRQPDGAQAPNRLPDAEQPDPNPRGDAAARRASIAVMPFADLASSTPIRGGLADALAHDIITRLARLRSLFVIAQGTVFALNERQLAPCEVGRLLTVDYTVSGTVRRHGPRLTVTAELVDTSSARIVWTDIFDGPIDDTLLVLDSIGNQIVACIAGEIEANERNRAILKPPNSLDAWEALHRGLWHMYRFNRSDNAQAQHFFSMAVQHDPSFARAWAGLSFTHFQNAFQGWGQRATEIDRAFETAGQSLIADERNPAAHWAMGRATWLRGQQDRAVAELTQAIDLSPSFALAHYTLAFVQAQAGDAPAAIASSDHSRLLSPYDPLLFGMLGARAIALVRMGQFDEAAQWAVKAAARPNAHAHIFGIAAFSLALAGSLDDAQAHAAHIHMQLPGYTIDDFLKAFHLDALGTARFRQGARQLGMA